MGGDAIDWQGGKFDYISKKGLIVLEKVHDTAPRIGLGLVYLPFTFREAPWVALCNLKETL